MRKLRLMVCIVLLVLAAEVTTPLSSLAEDKRQMLADQAFQLDAAGKYTEAASVFQQLIQLEPGNYGWYYDLAVCLRQLNRPRDAWNALQRALQLEEREPWGFVDDPQLWILLVNLYKDLKDEKGAAWAMEQCKKKFPYDPYVNLLVSENLSGNQKTAALMKIANSVTDYRILYNVAFALKDAGAYAEAAEKMKQCVKLRPDDPKAYLALDDFYVCAGKVEEALATRKEFANKFPNHDRSKGLKEQVDFYVPEVGSVRNYENQEQATGNADQWYRWHSEDMPLKVYIHERWKRRTVWSVEQQTGDHDSSKSFGALVEHCLDDWTTASGGAVAFCIVNSPQDANIEIDWTINENQLTHSWAEGEAGFGTNKQGRPMRKVYLLTVNRNDHTPVSVDEFTFVALHEIGHALGLSHSSNPADVMYVQWHPKIITKLSSNDVARLRRLYAKER